MGTEIVLQTSHRQIDFIFNNQSRLVCKPVCTLYPTLLPFPAGGGPTEWWLHVGFPGPSPIDIEPSHPLTSFPPRSGLWAQVSL